jgi:hypothetical protein
MLRSLDHISQRPKYALLLIRHRARVASTSFVGRVVDQPALYPMRMRTFFITGVAVTICVIAVVAWFFFGDTIQERLRRRPFDAAAWRGEKTLTNDVRIRMVDDLLRRHNFRGMTRDQVTAIAGEPDTTGYFKEWDLVYWLGPERGFMSIDSEWLVFRLDRQKIVTDSRIVRD